MVYVRVALGVFWLTTSYWVVNGDINITVHPPSVYSKTGSNVGLVCKASGDAVDVIYWKRGTQQLNASVSDTGDGKQSTLTLMKVQLSDAGDNYYCLAESNNDSVSVKSQNVTVGVLANVSFSSESFSVGSTEAELECIVAGYPKPIAQFMGDGTSLSPSSDMLSDRFYWTFVYKFSDFGVAHGGLYVCNVSFEKGNISLSDSAEIRVLPKIVDSPINRSLTSPTDLSFSCRAIGYPLPNVTWTRSLGDINETMMAVNTRNESLRSVTSKLYLPKANISNAGKYTCTANDEVHEGIESSSGFLFVAAKILAHSQSVLYNRDSRINLTCSAEGYPYPDIDWVFRNETFLGQTIAQSATERNSVLVVSEKANPIDHGGMYTCRAVNDHGSAVEESVTVSFEQEVVSPPKSIAVSYGDRLNLSCEITGYPVNASVQWFKDGHILKSRLSEDRMNLNGTSVMSRLVITDVTQEQCGNYSCFVSSAATVGLKSHLTVKPTVSTIVIQEGERLSMSCGAVGCPLPSLTWHYRADMNNKFTNISAKSVTSLSNVLNSDLEIDSVNRSISGYYSCCAENRPGVVTHRDCSNEVLVDVKFSPSITKPPAKEVEVKEGELLTLLCTVVGNPLPSVTWLRINKVCDEERRPPISDDKVTFDNSTSTSNLTIRVGREDSGHYFCGVANNVLSEPSVVFVLGRPGVVNSSSVSIVHQDVGLVTVLWSPPCDYFSPILYYLVSYAVVGNALNQPAENISSNMSLQANLSDLKPYEQYHVQIVAVNAIGTGDSVTKMFESPPGVSSAPLNFSSDEQSVSPSSINLSWGHPEVPNGIIQSYRVYFLYVMPKWQHEQKVRRSVSLQFWEFDGNVTSGVVSNLQPYTIYRLQLHAVNKIGTKDIVGNGSRVIEAVTAEGAPLMPTNVTASLVLDKADSLKITWNAPLQQNGIIRSYIVHYSLASVAWPPSAAKKHDTGSSSTEVVLQNLTAFTSYHVAVKAVTVRAGNLSTSTTGKTDQAIPTNPQDLQIGDVGSSSVYLWWHSPEYSRGILQKYTIYYRGNRTLSSGTVISQIGQVEVNGSDPSNHTRLDNLHSGFAFKFNVTASTVKGESRPSATKQTTTKPTGPSTPFPLVIVKSSKTTITVNLTRPIDDNGDIDYVQLLVAEIPRGSSESEARFNLAAIKGYSPNLSALTPYITAHWSYEELESYVLFDIGNGKVIGNYTNEPLKEETTYAVVVKAVTVSAEQLLFSFTEPQTAATSVTSSSSSNDGVIAGVVVAIIVIVVIAILLLFILHRMKSRKQKYSRETVYENAAADGDVVMANFVKPIVVVPTSEVVGLVGNCVLLEVETTGYPRAKVTWRFGGRDLPGSDNRIKILPDGSLQIIGAAVSDSGLYRCQVSNRVGSSHCQVKLRVEVSAEDIAEEHDPIPVAEFEEYVAEMHESRNEGFSAEYSLLEKQTNKFPAEASRLECNVGKNRYGNIYSYDHSRVVLNAIEGVPGSDYINASHINAYKKPKGYIAAQGPNEATTDDFWRMIWQEKVGIVVMLTNLEEKGRVKCHQYWPDSSDVYDSIAVTLDHELIVAESISRSFSLQKELPDGSSETRTLQLFHYIDWPDHGVPRHATPLLRFLRRVQSCCITSKSTVPIVVHCSAGVGRSGSYIAIDYTIEKIRQDKEIDLFNLVYEMRQSRPSMVQTEAQYVFIHDAILEYYLCGDTEIPASSLRTCIQELNKVDDSVGVSGIRHQHQLLNKVSPPKKSFRYSAASEQVNIYKNRYSDLIPTDDYRVNLNPVAGRPSHCTYINATYVDGYTHHNMYITTQGPVTNTVPDFWRMVWEQGSEVIVMLSQLDEDGMTMSARYWPSQGTGDFDMFNIILDEEKNFGDYIVRKLQVANKKESEVRTVTQFHYTSWHNNQVPQSASSLIEIIGRVERAQMNAKSNPLIVMCNNGVGRSGTYCAISVIIDRLKTEQVVDVFQVVKQMRIHNPDFVTRMEDYQFCYNAAAEFMEAFDTYSNFRCSEC